MRQNMFKLRPSAAASWVVCHAAPSLRSGYPDDSGNAAEEGTAAHFVGSQLILGRPVRAGDIAPNGIEIDSEMMKYGAEYLDVVSAWNLPVVCERYIDIPDISDNFGGTPDAWAVDYLNKVIKIIDYKYGYQLVDTFENWQMLCYLSGIIDILKLDGLTDQQWAVEFTVFQPRAYHMDGQLRTWKTTVSNMRPFFNKLRAAAANCFLPNPKTEVGAQCRYCSARHTCVTLQKSNYVAIQIASDADIFELNTTQAGNELLRIEAALEILKARQTGLAAQIEHDILAGKPSQHFSLERAKTREKWQEGKDLQVIAMGTMLGFDCKKPFEAKSPAQLRKLGVDASVINEYSVTPIGEQKLVRLSTKTTRKLFER